MSEPHGEPPAVRPRVMNRKTRGLTAGGSPVQEFLANPLDGFRMDRHWLLTWTCYGHWLPGDSRGFVGNVRDTDGKQLTHNVPGTPYDAAIPALERHVRGQMTGNPVTLDRPQAEALIIQYQETALVRGWRQEAASVMFNHTHLVVGVNGDPDPQSLLETCKSWATRAMKKLRPLPPNGAFWTANGSKSKLVGDRAVRDAVIYVARKQPNPLAVWSTPEWRDAIAEYDAG